MEKNTSAKTSGHDPIPVQEKLKALRTAINEGLESGPAELFDVETFIAEKDRDRKRT